MFQISWRYEHIAKFENINKEQIDLFLNQDVISNLEGAFYGALTRALNI